MYFVFCLFLDHIKVFELVPVLLNNQKDIYSIYKSANICFCWTKLSEPLLLSLYQKLQVSRLCMLSIERRLKLFVVPEMMLSYSPLFFFFAEIWMMRFTLSAMNMKAALWCQAVHLHHSVLKYTTLGAIMKQS